MQAVPSIFQYEKPGQKRVKIDARNLSRQRESAHKIHNDKAYAISALQSQKITIENLWHSTHHFICFYKNSVVAALRWNERRSYSYSTSNAWITYSSQVTCNLNEFLGALYLFLSCCVCVCVSEATFACLLSHHVIIISKSNSLSRSFLRFQYHNNGIVYV